ncbi:MAG: hypothetical protein Q4B17_01470 [Lautropia sp.]|nr:hypothetical protein [Lautropia sp.]
MAVRGGRSCLPGKTNGEAAGHDARRVGSLLFLSARFILSSIVDRTQAAGRQKRAIILSIDDDRSAVPISPFFLFYESYR